MRRTLARCSPTVLLAGIVVLAVFVRLTLLAGSAAWGVDLGIYLGLAEEYDRTGQPFPAYDGWGSSYNGFPVLPILVTWTHDLTGVPIITVLQLLPPLLSGLTVLAVYAFVREMDPRRGHLPALLAAGILAVDPVHAYQTAHGAPHTLGHVFLALSLFLFVRWRRHPAAAFPLAGVTLGLVASHHLGTYMLIVGVAGLIVWSELRADRPLRTTGQELLYLQFVVGCAAIHWTILVPEVGLTFVPGAARVPLPALLAVLWGLVAGGVGLARLRRRLLPRWTTDRPVDWERFPKVAGTAAAIILSAAVFTIVPVPSTAWRFAPAAPLLLAPLAIFVGLACAGVRDLHHRPAAAPAIGLLAVFGASFGLSLFLNRLELPFRHLEYLAYPLAIAGGYGLAPWVEAWLHAAVSPGQGVEHRAAARAMPRPTGRAGGPLAALAAVGLLLAVSGASVGALQRSTGGADERIPAATLRAAAWLGAEHADEGIVASDHRVSQLLWASNLTTPRDDLYYLWHAPTAAEARPELLTARADRDGPGAACAVRYVVVDSVMSESAVTTGLNETQRPMSEEALAKYDRRPFTAVHQEWDDDGGWATVYRVDPAFCDP